MKELEYGVDVTARRADDLDRKALARVFELQQSAPTTDVTVIDLGAGSGGQATRFQAAGATVIAVDCADYSNSQLYHHVQTRVNQPISFVLSDMNKYVQTLEEGSITICHLQRVVHYLPHAAAIAMLRTLSLVVTDRLYVSVTGSESAIGRAYHYDVHTPLSKRYSVLSIQGQEDFCISAPMCLYSYDEFCTTIASTGWTIIESWTSAFGNIKIIARPTKYTF